MKPPLAASKVCYRCGKTYAPLSNRQRYCSGECRSDNQVCTECGRTFDRKPHTTGSFCSKECWARSVSKLNDVACLACGKTFHRKAPNQRYCSMECGDVGRSAHRGPRSNRWGGGRMMRRGYVLIHAPNHPSLAGSQRKHVLEHRLVMEEKLGRLLLASENVHHLNGIRDDNRPENLELWKRSQPSGIRGSDYHCPGCRCAEVTDLM